MKRALASSLVLLLVLGGCAETQTVEDVDKELKEENKVEEVEEVEAESDVTTVLNNTLGERTYSVNDMSINQLEVNFNEILEYAHEGMPFERVDFEVKHNIMFYADEYTPAIVISGDYNEDKTIRNVSIMLRTKEDITELDVAHYILFVNHMIQAVNDMNPNIANEIMPSLELLDLDMNEYKTVEDGKLKYESLRESGGMMTIIKSSYDPEE